MSFKSPFRICETGLAYLIRHLGRVAFLLFLISAVSGIMLAAHYRSSAPYASVCYITKSVRFGLYARSVHYWSANLLILSAALHMLRSFLQGKHKASRRSWVVGALMGLVVIGCGFTGTLLVWNQRAYWATVVGVGSIETLPCLGDAVKMALLGGPEISLASPERFNALHTLAFPALLLVLMISHLQSFDQLWEFLLDFARRLGIVGTKGADDLEDMDTVVFSDLLLELMEIFCVTGLVLALAFLFPPELGEKANPLMTPSRVKPEWYLLFVYQGLKYLPETAGFVLFFLAIPSFVILLPFIDRSPSSTMHPVKRPLAATLIFLALLILVGLSILGWFAK